MKNVPVQITASRNDSFSMLGEFWLRSSLRAQIKRAAIMMT
jgi:hypothetical protein